MSREKQSQWLMGIVAVSLLIVLVFGWWMWDYLKRDPLKRALPEVASILYEGGTTIGTDSFSYFKAEIDEPLFHEYCERLDLTPHHPGRKYTDDMKWLSWERFRVYGTKGVREPVLGLEGTYVRQEGHHWVFAKWENGAMYVMSVRH